MTANALIFMLGAWGIIGFCSVFGLLSIVKHQK